MAALAFAIGAISSSAGTGVAGQTDPIGDIVFTHMVDAKSASSDLMHVTPPAEAKPLTSHAPEFDWTHWSSDGRKIFLTSYLAGLKADALWSIRPDGSALTRLWPGVPIPYPVAWSPLGTRVALDRAGRIEIRRADGKLVKTLRRRLRDIDGLRWSPNGARIAISTSSPIAVWMVELKTQKWRRLTRPLGPGDSYEPLGFGGLAWAPGGRFVSANLELVDWIHGGVVVSRVWIIPTAQRPRVVLAGSDCGDWNPDTSDECASGWSPDGRTLAFVNGSSLWTVSPDGRDRHRVAKVSGLPAYPAWSRDGRRIVFAGAGGQYKSLGGTLLLSELKMRLYVVDVRRARARLLRAGETVALDPRTRPGAWAPTGSSVVTGDYVAVARRTSKGYVYPEEFVETPARVEVWTPAGRRIIARPALDLGPSWSPDGTRLAFTRVVDASIRLIVRDEAGERVVGSWPAKDKDLQPMWRDDAGLQAVWSRDGTRLAFTRDRLIYVIGADGGQAQLTAHGWTPSWGPEGQLAFVSPGASRLSVQTSSGERKVFEVPPLPSSCDPWDWLAVEGVGWSPEGSRIAFGLDGSSYCGDTRLGVYVVSPDGSDLRFAGDGYGRFAWSADPTRLMMMDGGVTTIAGLGGEQLARLPIAGSNPAWSPDGVHFAFVRSGKLFVGSTDGVEYQVPIAGENDEPAWRPHPTRR